MSETKVRLSFNVGPVQGFVAQARRTKDFWAGSWLLSYLSECALAAAESEACTAIIPHRDPTDCQKLTSLRSPVGGIPNRFELDFTDQSAAKSAAEKACESFRAEWKAIADEVWNQYVRNFQDGANTLGIWQQQVDNFWELSWMVTEAPGVNELAGEAIQARKAFRNAPATIEPGTKCSLMSDYQELSGIVGVHKDDTEKRKKFWESAREFLREQGEGLDLGKSEQLCAIALIKRCLPNIIKSLPLAKCNQARKPENLCKDLKKQAKWPSLAFFAALPWIKELDEAAKSDGELESKLTRYANEAMQKDDPAGFWESEAAPVELFFNEAPKPAWAKVDATAWFVSGVRNNNEIELGEVKSERLLKKLKSIYKQAAASQGQGADAQRPPLPYYALLFMDGDSMGELLGALGDPTELSRCLSEFSKRVKDIVRKHDGRAVYAGGDDVLAFLPAKNAFEAADELSFEYKNCFKEYPDAQERATLSGALLYAYWKFPLSQVIRLSHHLLDDIAKDATGRDSLAMALIQGGGINAVYSAPWSVWRGCEMDKQGQRVPPLATFVDRFAPTEHQQDDSRNGPVQLNSSYLYGLRNQFAGLFDLPNVGCGKFNMALNAGSQDVLLELAHSEYRRRMSRTARINLKADDTRPQVAELMAYSKRWRRDSETRVVSVDDNTFVFDGWRIARFLRQVQEGVLPEHE